MSPAPLRGKSGRERRAGDRAISEANTRRLAHAAGGQHEGRDFDEAEVDSEVADFEEAQERALAAARPASAEIGTPAAARAGGDAGKPARRLTPGVGQDAPAAGRRLPDLAVLPPLLHGSGAFADLRRRLGAAEGPVPASGRHAGLTNVPHGAKTYLAAALAAGASGERLVWVARDAEIGDRVAEELQAWLGDPTDVAVLEPRTALAYERSELVPDETSARVAALSAWKSGRARILVASVQALLQHTIDPADLPERPWILQPAARVSPDELLHRLFGLGYVPVFEVAGRGEFARRGGIVDVFPPTSAFPVRIEFFGDEIDSIRSFDPTDQRTIAKRGDVELLPASEFLLPEGGVQDVRARLKGAGAIGDRLTSDLERFGTSKGEAGTRAIDVGDAAEVWSAILAPSTGIDHIPASTLLVLDEPGDLAESAEFLWRQADERRAELIDNGELPKHWPSTYLARRAWKNRLVASRTLELTWESEAADALAGGGLSMGDAFGWHEPGLPPGRSRQIAEAVDLWTTDSARVVLASDQSARLADLLAEAGRAVGAVIRLREAPPPGAVSLVERSLNGGFAGGPDGLVFVTDRELFGSVRVRRPRALRRVVPRDILERLTPGDLVVHIDHGIARYERMLRRGAEGEERDYLELAFNGTDRIYVPVEQIARLSRYAGAEKPQLSRLGGLDWQKTKARVKKAVTDLAKELLALYASRNDARGHPFAADSPWQQEMEASFPYEETVDQLRATAEAKSDMESGRPMDRLVVGDVGYGKTEVALRAAF
jgi:transcription-repair coupling factor (superfamily II helicase)